MKDPEGGREVGGKAGRGIRRAMREREDELSTRGGCQAFFEIEGQSGSILGLLPYLLSDHRPPDLCGCIRQMPGDRVRWDVRNLLPGSLYFFRVAAVNRMGQGPWSETTDMVP